MITDSIFETLKPTAYANAKSQIQNGDIMLCSGEGFISNAIKQATKSVFSHVALILKLHASDQWLVAESVESHGVRCVALEQGYLQNYMDSGKGYPGKILIARYSNMPENLEALYHQAFTLMGDRYNEQDIFKIATRIALNDALPNSGDQQFQQNPQAYICSEYVNACLKAININLPFDPLGFIAPADIARAPGVNAVLQLQPV